MRVGWGWGGVSSSQYQDMVPGMILNPGIDLAFSKPRHVTVLKVHLPRKFSNGKGGAIYFFLEVQPTIIFGCVGLSKRNRVLMKQRTRYFKGGKFTNQRVLLKIVSKTFQRLRVPGYF